MLPLGSVRAEGWLLRQLEKQRDGLTGHAEELYDDIGVSDWLTNAGRSGQYAWERGPYYAKGLVALALTLDDAALKQKARRWGGRGTRLPTTVWRLWPESRQLVGEHDCAPLPEGLGRGDG